MPSPKTSRPPPDRQAASPAPSARGLGTLAGMAVLGGVLGLLLGVAAGLMASRSRPVLWLAGSVFGLTAGLGAGFWKTRGGNNGKPRLRPGEGLSNHILALQEALASAPPKRAERITAHQGGVTAVALSPDGKSALSGGMDRAVKLWDLSTGFQLREFGDFAGPVHGVAFSPDGRLAAACGTEDAGAKESGVVLVWDVESGREMRRLDAGEPLYSLAFAPRSRLLLAGGAGHLRLWDLEADELLTMIPVRADRAGVEEVLSVAVSPDRKLALCACRYSQEARLFDIETGECVKRFTGHRAWLRLFPSAVTAVAFSPDGERVLTGGRDGTARVWDAESGVQKTKVDGRGVVAVAFLPDGKRAVSAGEDGAVRVWGVKKGDEVGRFDHGARLYGLAVSRDGRVLISGGGDGVIRVWEVPE